MANNNNPPRPHGGPTGMRVVSKPKNFKKSIARLFGEMRGYYIIVSVALTLAIGGTLLSIFGPKIAYKMQEIFAVSQKAGLPIDMSKISEYGIWLIILYSVSFVCSYIQGFIMSSVTAVITKRMRSQISSKINRLPLRYFDNNSYGDTLSRITNDVDTIGQTLNNSLSSMITSITMLIGVPIMMFTIDWKLTLIVLVTLPVSMILVMIIVKASQKYFKRQQDSLGEINGHIEESYSGHSVIKVFNYQDKSNEKFDKINGELYTSSIKSQFFSGLMMPVMNFVGNLGYAVVCIIGAISAINSGSLASVAAIPVFLIYIRLFNQPLQQIASVASTLQSTAAASERVFDFLDEEEQSAERENLQILDKVKGQVEFRDVSFGYTKDKEIIHKFSCMAKPGQKVAIVGPTGAGKTTIVNLLMRFYDVDSGDILIDGISIKDMSRSYVRSLFGMVLQDAWLFDGTIRENIAYGKQDATDEEIKRAGELANIDHYVSTLPNGYDMVLDEDSSLSQGQRQLLTIARATVQNTPMLILDEATSAVDTRTEVLLQEAMDRLMKGRTSFVIAHRLSTIKNADLILVMKNGNIVEQGTHNELLAKDGFYADLYNSQFSKAKSEVIE